MREIVLIPIVFLMIQCVSGFGPDPSDDPDRCSGGPELSVVPGELPTLMVGERRSIWVFPQGREPGATKVRSRRVLS